MNEVVYIAGGYATTEAFLYGVVIGIFIAYGFIITSRLFRKRGNEEVPQD